MAGKLTGITTAGLLLFSMTAHAQRLAGEQGSDHTTTILRALDAQTRLHFEETPLGECVDYVKDYHGIEIAIDHRGLDEVGLDTRTPVTVRIHGVTLESGLNHILRSIDAGLIWTIHDETLLITTEEAAYELQEVVIYDVGQLIHSPEDYYGDYDGLIELITRNIVPDSWDEVGGPASISQYEGRRIQALVVTQTTPVHRRIERLIRKLHQLGGHPIPVVRPLRHGEADRIMTFSDAGDRVPGGTSIWNPRKLPMTKPRGTKLVRREQQQGRRVAAPNWLRSAVHGTTR